MAASVRYKELLSKKNDIESTIKELQDLLESQKGVGMTESLVDPEGFPREDIDVYSVRHARHQISCLQNDHLDIMKQIEEELYRIHSEAKANKMESDVALVTVKDVAMEIQKSPFAVVDRVDAGSPAANGGIEVGDKLIEFGSVVSENFVNLSTLGTVMQHSKNKPVNVLVERNGRHAKLTVTPSEWSGRGLLGCNIKPLPK